MIAGLRPHFIVSGPDLVDQIKCATYAFVHAPTIQTASGLRGSVRWSAPELLMPDGSVTYNEKTDVWAFGMTVLVRIVILSAMRAY